MVPLTMSKSRERLSVSSMSAFSENKFVSSLKVDPLLRSYQDLDIIYHGLQELPAFAKLRDSALRSLCAMVRYQRSDANDILYCGGELATCWYVLLSGAVFIQGSMFLPRTR